MSQLNVLVVGASIAGPSTAYWLAKTGAKVTVIERFPSLRTGGQNIDIRTAGVTTMRKIPGMEAAVRAKVIPLEGFAWVRSNGRPYGTIRATGDPDQQSLVSEYEIYRGDLSRIMYDLTRDDENVEYVFGEQVASIQQGEKVDGPVKVEFANGRKAEEYDLVIACDGATSRTRALGMKCGVRDYVHPTSCWAAYFTIKEDLVQGSKIGQAYSAPGRFLAAGVDPAGGNKATLMSISPSGDTTASASFREAQKQGDEALKTFVSRRFGGAGWKADEILRGMWESNDFYASEIVQVKLPSYSQGRFALVGDAGYAPGFTGAGTTLALAGAYLLAGEIGKHKGDLAAGLRGYEENMKPLVTEMQKVPPIIPGVLAPQTEWGLWLRNYIFAFVTWTGIINFAQKYLAGAFANSDKFPLPEYEWER